MKRQIWIWQNVLSPHMAGLAASLALRGHEVRYIAQKLSRADRAELGWTMPSLGKAELVHCKSPKELEVLASNSSPGAEHIFQGFRGNGHLAKAYKTLARRNIPFWVFLEVVDDRGWRGIARRAYYRYLFARWQRHLNGVLAVGETMPAWVANRGMATDRIYPFTYFLYDHESPAPKDHAIGSPFRIVFVGSLIERKGVDVLLTAFSKLNHENYPPKLDIIGSGSDEQPLKDLAVQLGVSDSVSWLGSRKIDEIPQLIATADLLVLPSRFDGWGAVVSEALMVGTPAIATDRCGAAAAVRASGCGAAVPANDATALCNAIRAEISRGPITAELRSQLARWATAFGAEKGASYLSELFDAVATGNNPPVAPWVSSSPWITGQPVKERLASSTHRISRG